MQPRALEALIRREDARVRRSEMREEALAAQLMATIINFSFRAPKEPVKVEDMLPRRRDQEKRAGRLKKLSKKRQQEIAESFRRLFRDINRSRGWADTRSK